MITIRYSAGRKTLTMDGHTYDLHACDTAQFNRLVGSLRRRFEKPKRKPRRKKV